MTENEREKKKTIYIVFSSLKITDYVSKNSSTILSKKKFSVRSETFNIKVWNTWKYNDNICVGCKSQAKTKWHFMTCQAYSKETEDNHLKILAENFLKNQLKIAEKIFLKGWKGGISLM